MKKINIHSTLIGASILTISGMACYFYFKQKSKKPSTFLSISIGGTHTRVCLLKKNEFLNSFTVLGTVHEFNSQFPLEVIKSIKENFKSHEFDCIAIASFGPLHLKRDQNYGDLVSFASKQKKLWEGVSITKQLSSFYMKHCSIETDVNAAAIAEYRLGNHGKINSLAYITIGTGVGVGLVINGKTVHGFLHPEGGHTT